MNKELTNLADYFKMCLNVEYSLTQQDMEDVEEYIRNLLSQITAP